MAIRVTMLMREFLAEFFLPLRDRQFFLLQILLITEDAVDEFGPSGLVAFHGSAVLWEWKQMSRGSCRDITEKLK